MHGNLEPEERILKDVKSKIRQVFKGCFNYNKLKKEGLINEDENTK
jgi:hypothetical protein